MVCLDGMDKVSEISHHPLAANVLLSTSEDAGEGVVRVWDALSGDVIAKAKVPGKGVGSSSKHETAVKLSTVSATSTVPLCCLGRVRNLRRSHLQGQEAPHSRPSETRYYLYWHRARLRQA